MIKIIESTDDKNLGMELILPSINDEIELNSGFIFKVKDIKINDDFIILSNDNYIIVCVTV